MSGLFTIIIVLQVLSALAIIGLVLVQHGKGADMGAAFGSGASGSLFGASGSSNFLSKSTAVAAVVFFLSTLALVYVSNQRIAGGSVGVMDKLPAASAVISEQKPQASAATPGKTPSAPVPGTSGTVGQIPK
ncbi:MAG: preprotein translocase subunit SecG [Burkholderiaceae bacterium]|nr:preprotein translocase subunit SecG [Burkholderiaceae bacterium]